MNIQFTSIEEYKEFFGISEGEPAYPRSSTIFNINGKSYSPLSFSIGKQHSYYSTSVEMTLIRIFPKSAEQIAAEESVNKAKESLKAAEAALKAVTEKE